MTMIINQFIIESLLLSVEKHIPRGGEELVGYKGPNGARDFGRLR